MGREGSTLTIAGNCETRNVIEVTHGSDTVYTVYSARHSHGVILSANALTIVYMSSK